MARTGEPRKPVSRKKAAAAASKGQGAPKRRRGARSAPVALPRPSKLSFIIVGAGAALLVALWFLVVKPTVSAAESAAEDRAAAERVLRDNESRLEQHESKQVYQGASLTEVVSAAEEFLPFFEEADPAVVVGEIANTARATGLTVGGYSIPPAYTSDAGARVLNVTFTDVSGPPAAVTEWFTTLSSMRPLVTFETSGASVSEDSMTLTVNVTVWASADEAWSSGGGPAGEVVDLGEGLGGLTGQMPQG